MNNAKINKIYEETYLSNYFITDAQLANEGLL